MKYNTGIKSYRFVQVDPSLTELGQAFSKADVIITETAA